jgi:hypothetical protein
VPIEDDEPQFELVDEEAGRAEARENTDDEEDTTEDDDDDDER